MSLKLKVFLAVVIACTALFAAVVQLTVIEFRLANSYTADRGMPRTVSAVIHELQIERGKSAGMIAAGYPQNLQDGVAEQRAKVDKAVAAFQDYVGRTPEGAHAPEVSKSIQTALVDLRGIPDFRARVDQRSSSRGDTVKFYTHQIDDLISVLGHIAQHSKTEATASRIMPFLALVRAKEHGGLERALGAVLLTQAGKGEVELSTYRTYLGRAAGERNALASFASVASAEYAGWLEQALQAPVVAQVEDVRNRLAEIIRTNDNGGVAGPAYFAAATERLNLIKSVEDRIVSDYETVSKQRNYPPPGGVVSGRDGTLNGLKGSCACKASGIHNGA